MVTVEVVSEERNSPEFLRFAKSRGVTAKALANAAGVSRFTVWRHAAGKSWPTIEERLAYAKAMRVRVEQIDEFMERASKELEGLRNTYAGEERLIEPPEYSLLPPAGRWGELTGAEDESSERNPLVIDQGLFRIRIFGDCMEPRWSDGDLIEFRIWREGREPMPVGRDVALTNSDGLTTFKTLKSFDGEDVILRAINPKYADPIIVPRQMVARIAVALHKIVKPIE